MLGFQSLQVISQRKKENEECATLVVYFQTGGGRLWAPRVWLLSPSCPGGSSSRVQPSTPPEPPDTRCPSSSPVPPRTLGAGGEQGERDAVRAELERQQPGSTYHMPRGLQSAGSMRMRQEPRPSGSCPSPAPVSATHSYLAAVRPLFPAAALPRAMKPNPAPPLMQCKVTQFAGWPWSPWYPAA